MNIIHYMTNGRNIHSVSDSRVSCPTEEYNVETIGLQEYLKYFMLIFIVGWIH